MSWHLNNPIDFIVADFRSNFIVDDKRGYRTAQVMPDK